MVNYLKPTIQQPHAATIATNTWMWLKYILDLSLPIKLLLWAYTLILHGCCENITAVVKQCEENATSKMNK
jgi:hypothetical protein